MRNINKFVVLTGMGDTASDVVDKSIEVGLEYPYPHFFILVGKNGETKVLKMRPIASRCALIRDSKVADSGVGILISGNNNKIATEVGKAIEEIIRLLSSDLAIDDYSIVSDEFNMDRNVDIANIPPIGIDRTFFKLR